MNRIKQLREEKDLNQVELGKIIGVSGQAMGMYENEKRKLDTKNASILADFFNVSVDYLLCKSDIRNPEELKNIKFANYGGLDTNGLDEDELLELQRQIDFIKKMKQKGNKR